MYGGICKFFGVEHWFALLKTKKKIRNISDTQNLHEYVTSGLYIRLYTPS